MANEAKAPNVLAIWLEPISKLPEEYDEASELDEAEEVLWVVLPSDQDAPLPLNPGEETFNEPPPCISAEPPTVLGWRSDAVGTMRSNQLDAIFA